MAKPQSDIQLENAGSRRFSFPHEVAIDPALSITDKRALLCEWASDACAVESFPTLRLLPGTSFPVTFSAIMDALGELDRLSTRQEEQELSERGVVIDFARRKGTQHMEH
jgi:hypothetical protein